MGEDQNEEIIKDAFHNNNELEWFKFPFEIVDVEETVNRELLADFTGERTGFVQVGPKKYFFPSGYRKNAEIYYNFQPRPSDIWIVTFPRSGTTWTQELVWLLGNDLNYDLAAKLPLGARFPFLEFTTFVHAEVKAEFLKENEFSQERLSLVEKVTYPAWKTLLKTTQRRFIKTHLPFSLLSPELLNVGCKVIYLARNPKDVAVSFYHLNRSFRTQGFVRDFPRYWHYFKNGLRIRSLLNSSSSDCFHFLEPWTPYWAHLQEGWEKRHEDNLLFMFYENLTKDLRQCIMRLSKFLNVEFSNEEYEKLEEHLKIDNFKKNKSVNGEVLKDLGILKSDEESFVRKGKSGGWKDYFVDDLNEDADQWIDENLEKIDLRFPTL